MKYYVCDPEKHPDCKSDICGKECVLTVFEEYARLDKDGNPVIAKEVNLNE